MFAERDRILEAHRDGDYVLWFEADLYDEPWIIQVLSRLADLGVPAHHITLIRIGEHPGIARFGGLGQLTAAQLRRLPETDVPVRLTPAALGLAVRAWAAFRAPTPDGLGAVAAGAADARAAFSRAAACESRPCLGDTWCFAIMWWMANARVPLPSVEPGGPVLPETRLRLTDAGAQVLAARADHVTLNGIDRWIGGEHLHGARASRRWDDGTKTLTAQF